MSTHDINNCINNKQCNYEIGQFVPQFYPLRNEAIISLTKSSFDIIIGLSSPEESDIKKLMEQINIYLFCFDKVPVLTIWNNYRTTLTTYVNVFNNDYAEPKDWVNETDDIVNIIIVDFHEVYKVVGIRRIKLPIMKRIREVCKEQLSLPISSMVDSSFDKIMCSFSDYKLNQFHEEECSFGKLSSEEIQIGSHRILEVDTNQIKPDMSPYVIPSLLQIRESERMEKIKKKLKGFPQEWK